MHLDYVTQLCDIIQVIEFFLKKKRTKIPLTKNSYLTHSQNKFPLSPNFVSSRGVQNIIEIGHIILSCRNMVS